MCSIITSSAEKSNPKMSNLLHFNKKNDTMYIVKKSICRRSP